MAYPDLELRRGGGGDGFDLLVVLAFLPFLPKIRGGAGPPGSFPQICHCDKMVEATVLVIATPR